MFGKINYLELMSLFFFSLLASTVLFTFSAIDEMAMSKMFHTTDEERTE